MVINQWMVGWLFNCTLKLSQLKCSKSFINRYCFVTKLCLTLSDPMDCSPPGSSFLGILQARTLEWVAISSSRGSSWSWNLNHISCIDRWVLYHWVSWGAPSYELFNWKTVHPGQDSWGSGLLISWGRLFSVVGHPVYWRVSPSLPSFYPWEPGSILPCPWELEISPDAVRPAQPREKAPWHLQPLLQRQLHWCSVSFLVAWGSHGAGPGPQPVPPPYPRTVLFRAPGRLQKPWMVPNPMYAVSFPIHAYLW